MSFQMSVKILIGVKYNWTELFYLFQFSTFSTEKSASSLIFTGSFWHFLTPSVLFVLIKGLRLEYFSVWQSSVYLEPGWLGQCHYTVTDTLYLMPYLNALGFRL